MPLPPPIPTAPTICAATAGSRTVSTAVSQPGWTLVGAGIFDRSRTERPMSRCIPHGAQWIRAAVAGFEPEQQSAVLEDGNRIGYRALVVCPGLKLNFNA